MLDAVESGTPEVFADDYTRHVKEILPRDQEAIYPELRERWALADSPWTD